jgi:hypothetical protein
MIVEDCNSEKPSLHWKYIQCKDQVAMDLGCGRWEQVEFRDPSWPTTPEYLIELGASKVIAVDIDPSEIEWYKANVSTKSNVVALHRNINSVDAVRELLNEYKPTVIKCDIEGQENCFLQLSDEEFCSVKMYALETHADYLHNLFLEKFNNLNYEVIATINLVHALPMKALFAVKK